MSKPKNKIERQREKIAKLKERNEALQKRVNKTCMVVLYAHEVIDDMMQRLDAWDSEKLNRYMSARVDLNWKGERNE